MYFDVDVTSLPDFDLWFWLTLDGILGIFPAAGMGCGGGTLSSVVCFYWPRPLGGLLVVHLAEDEGSTEDERRAEPVDRGELVLEVPNGHEQRDELPEQSLKSD